MSTWRDDIDKELTYLRKLANQLTDERTLKGIAALIADLETEKAQLPDKQ
jgi:hypothetical protein